MWLADVCDIEPATAREHVRLAHAYPASELAQAIAAWAEGHLDPADLAQRHHDARNLTWRVDIDGMVVLTARLPPTEAPESTSKSSSTSASAPTARPGPASPTAPLPGPGYSPLYNDAFIRLLLRDIHGNPIDATTDESTNPPGHRTSSAPPLHPNRRVPS